MKYQEFKNKVRRYPVITASLLRLLGEKEQILQNQLSRWQKQGLLVQLRRGMYLLNREDRALRPSQFFLANQIIFPSYVSLESALAYHHIIPEAVQQVTSVTTAKPVRYVTAEGTYTFRHVKSSLFFGFTATKDECGLEILVAEPEKALLDFLYLNLAQFSTADASIFFESYRWAGLEVLHAGRLTEYAARFSSRKLHRLVQLFMETHATEMAHA